jgi:hypothetical protein
MVFARSCTDHLFDAQIQPKHLPKYFFASFMQLMHNAMRKLQIWKQLLVLGGLLGDVPCIFMTRHPPSIKSPNKEPDDGLELRIPKTY